MFNIKKMLVSYKFSYTFAEGKTNNDLFRA